MFIKLYKHVIKKSLHQLNLQVNFSSAKQCTLCSSQSRKILLHSQLLPNFLQSRSCMGDSQNYVVLPKLTDDPPIVWPSFLKTFSNFIQANLVIKANLDNDFSIKEFTDGSRQAFHIVSEALSKEDYDSIKEVVAPNVLDRMRKKISSLSPEQKQLIVVEPEDVYVTFPYQIGIMFDNDKPHQRFVEITMVYHSLRGLCKMRARDEEPPMNMALLPEYQRLMFISNYRFIREFTKGVDSSWIINNINMFMPIMK